MLDRMSARFSRKRIKQISAAPLRLPRAVKALDPHERHLPAPWLSEQHGEVGCPSSSASARPRIEYSMVGYQALDPYGDAHILEVSTVSLVSFATDIYLSGSRHAQCTAMGAFKALAPGLLNFINLFSSCSSTVQDPSSTCLPLSFLLTVRHKEAITSGATCTES